VLHFNVSFPLLPLVNVQGAALYLSLCIAAGPKYALILETSAPKSVPIISISSPEVPSITNVSFDDNGFSGDPTVVNDVTFGFEYPTLSLKVLAGKDFCPPTATVHDTILPTPELVLHCIWVNATKTLQPVAT
jgi:hypothetical protein